MDPQTLVIVLRMAERILGVLLGGLLIYFGYRLFLSIPGKRTRGQEAGSGDFSFVGTKIKLSKVGPGVFFALFGAGLVVFSITRPVEYTTSSSTPAPISETKVLATTQVTKKFIGAVAVPDNQEERARRRAEVVQQIALLNQTVERANASDRAALEAAVAEAKLAMMERWWTKEWGTLFEFRDWLEHGGTPPEKTRAAIGIYERK